MAVAYLDNVFVVSTTTGTGTLTQSGTVTGYAAPASGDNGKTFVIMVKLVDANGLPTGEWELCESVYTHSGTWSRGTLLGSSTGSRVSFSAGTKTIAVVLAGRELQRPEIAVNAATSLDFESYVCSDSGSPADYTHTLPSVAGNGGRQLEVRIADTMRKLVTLDAGAGFNINGNGTALAAAITTTNGTSITVSSATGFPDNSFVIQIDSELMLVTAGFQTTTWTVVRGISGSTATTHSNGAAVDYQRKRVMWGGEVAKLRATSTGWAKIAGKTIPMVGRLIATGSQTPTRSTFVNLTLPSAQIDNTGLLCDTSAYKITAQRPGYYYFACGTSIITPTDFATFIIALYKNSTSTYRVFRNASSTSGANWFSGVGSQVLNLVAGDYINGQIYYYDPTTNRSTEYINPDSVSFLECTEIPTW